MSKINKIKLTFLNHYLKQNRITQKELAEKVGLSHRVITAYALGTSQPTLGPAFAIAKALNISINELVLGPNIDFNDKNNHVDIEISVDENILLTFFRKLTNDNKENFIKKVIEKSSGIEKFKNFSSNEKKEIINEMNSLEKEHSSFDEDNSDNEPTTLLLF